MRFVERTDAGVFRQTKDFIGSSIPQYAILSHTWGADHDEVTFAELRDNADQTKRGYDKIRFCGEQAQRDGLQYFWIDTCCIDKSNNTELSEAINSMFRWYRNAAKCYVYLSDVSSAPLGANNGLNPLPFESSFRASRWFTRGWTLQELLAPRSVEFFSQEGTRLGDKKSLERQVHEITGVAILALDGFPLAQFSVEERFRWAQNRVTTREEDWAYSLLGLFDIFMPLIYGEGKEKAVLRLRKEIHDTLKGPVGLVVSNSQYGVGAAIPHPPAAANVASNRALPCYHIPLPKNRRFVGRDGILDELGQMFFVQDCHKIAVMGLGGIGKTQVALKFAYWTKEHKREYSIFWVPALSKASFEQAYVEMAKKLPVPKGSEDEDPKDSVRQYLSSEAAGQWLLVVDNADDAKLLFGDPDTPGLYEYLPESEAGLVLFTTRAGEVAHSAAEQVIELDEMGSQEALDLLNSSLSRKIDDNAAAGELLDELAYLPLAITQAAAYIKINRISIATYLGLLHGTEQDMVSLMTRGFHDTTRYRGSQNAVATTWLVSFDQIRKSDSIAAILLSFMSCIEPKAIPRSILPQLGSEEQMVHAIGTLRGYTLLVRRGDDKLFDMHALVHLATRIWVQKEGLATQTMERATGHIATIFPSHHYMNRDLWRQYLPHALRILYGDRAVDTEERFALSLSAGICLREDGRIKEATRCYEDSWKWAESHMSEDRPGRLLAQHGLGIVYVDNGQFRRAIELLEHLVISHQGTLAEDDDQAPSSRYLLAGAYQHDGQAKKAIELYEHVISIWKRTRTEDNRDLLAAQSQLGRAYIFDSQVKKATELLEHIATLQEAHPEDDPCRLMSQTDLALAYRANNQVKKAIELLEHVIVIRERTLAEDDPNRLATQHDLAVAYRANNQVKKAIELLEHVVVIRERTLAEDNSHRLEAQHDLAVAYRANNQVKKAIELLEHVIVIRERTLAEDDPNRLEAQHDLAVAYRANSQVKKAIELLEHVIVIRERTLAEDDPNRLATQHDLAVAYRANSQVKKAIELLEHVIVIRERTLAEDDPNRLVTQHELAVTYRTDKQTKRAIELLEHVVAIREKSLPEDDPSRLASQLQLAVADRANNSQDKKAIKLLEHVVAIREKSLPEDDPSRLASQYELAVAYRANNSQDKKAIKLLEHVVAIREKSLPEDDPNRLVTQHELAVTYRTDKQTKRAIELLEHVVAIGERTLPENDPGRLASQHELAVTYRTDKQTKRAIELLEHVVAIGERTLPEDDPGQLSSQYELAMTYRSDRQIGRAIKLLEHVVAIRERTLPEDDPCLLDSQYELAMTYGSDRQIGRAIKLLEHVVAIQERTLPEDDPCLLDSQYELAMTYGTDGQVGKTSELLKHIARVERVERAEHAIAVEERPLAEETPLVEERPLAEERPHAEGRPNRRASQQELTMSYGTDGQVRKAIELFEQVGCIERAVAVEERPRAEDHPDGRASQGANPDTREADGQ